MWAFLVGLLPFLQDIVNWWSGVQAAQTAATNAETSAEQQHSTDGAQSVEDKTSTDAQNAALDAVQQQLENPTPVVVVTTPPSGGANVKPNT